MWSLPLSDMVLGSEELHLWFLGFSNDTGRTESCWQVLSAAERSKAYSFVFEKDAQQYIQTRGVLRYLLGQYLKQSPASITFEQNEFGKPLLISKPKIHFNVSHTDGAALLGFTSITSLGVDIENTNRKVEVDLVAKHFFAPKEVTFLQSLPPQHQLIAFYRCWTRKEAIIKAIGTGLSFPLKEFEVAFGPKDPARLLRTYWSEAEVDHWWMRAFELPGNYVNAVAMRAAEPYQQTWKWDNKLFRTFSPINQKSG